VLHVGLLVDALLPANDESEVLHQVGDVDVAAVESGFVDRAIEHAARRPDERPAGAVLLVARLLADQHDAGVIRSLPEDGLRRVPIELAAVALPDRFAHRAERRPFGEEIRRGGHADSLPPSNRP
jgi:hypothetical protein